MIRLALAAAGLLAAVSAARHRSKRLFPMAPGALDPGAPTMSRLVDFPNAISADQESSWVAQTADSNMQHRTLQQMHPSSTWEALETAIGELEPHEQRLVQCTGKTQPANAFLALMCCRGRGLLSS